MAIELQEYFKQQSEKDESGPVIDFKLQTSLTGQTALLKAIRIGRPDIAYEIVKAMNNQALRVKQQKIMQLEEELKNNEEELKNNQEQEQAINTGVNLTDQLGKSALIYLIEKANFIEKSNNNNKIYINGLITQLLAVPDININQRVGKAKAEYKFPLIYAIDNERVDIVNKLIARADIDLSMEYKYLDNQKQAKSGTSLLYAIDRGCINIASNMVRLEEQEKKKDDRSDEAIIVNEVKKNRWKDAVDLQDQLGKTALVSAIQKSETKLAKQILAIGANPDIADSLNQTALSYAIEKGFIDLAKEILDNIKTNNKWCTNINLQDNIQNSKQTTLIKAIKLGDKKIIKDILDLIKSDRTINITDSNGKNALIYAVEKGDRETVEEMLTNPNINLDIVDPKNKTALAYAFELSDPTIANIISAKIKNLSEEKQKLNEEEEKISEIPGVRSINGNY